MSIIQIQYFNYYHFAFCWFAYLEGFQNLQGRSFASVIGHLSSSTFLPFTFQPFNLSPQTHTPSPSHRGELALRFFKHFHQQLSITPAFCHRSSVVKHHSALTSDSYRNNHYFPLQTPFLTFKILKLKVTIHTIFPILHHWFR